MPKLWPNNTFLIGEKVETPTDELLGLGVLSRIFFFFFSCNEIIVSEYLKHTNNFLGRGPINMFSRQYIMCSEKINYNIVQEYKFKGSLKHLAFSEVLSTRIEKGISSSLT